MTILNNFAPLALFCAKGIFKLGFDRYIAVKYQGRIQGEGAGGAHTPSPLRRSLILHIRYKKFKICLPNRSVMSFLRGVAPPKKNPGSVPEYIYLRSHFKGMTYSAAKYAAKPDF